MYISECHKPGVRTSFQTICTIRPADDDRVLGIAESQNSMRRSS